MSFLTGFGVSSLLYYGLSVAFPPRPARFRRFEEIDLSGGELPGGGRDVRVSAVPDEKKSSENDGGVVVRTASLKSG
jgi:hypothetical protein